MIECYMHNFVSTLKLKELSSLIKSDLTHNMKPCIRKKKIIIYKKPNASKIGLKSQTKTQNFSSPLFGRGGGFLRKVIEKGKFTLETPQRSSCYVDHPTPRKRYTSTPAALLQGRDLVPIIQEFGWTPRADMEGCGKSRPYRDSISRSSSPQ